jgi:hypothetical protein
VPPLNFNPLKATPPNPCSRKTPFLPWDRFRFPAIKEGNNGGIVPMKMSQGLSPDRNQWRHEKKEK